MTRFFDTLFPPLTKHSHSVAVLDFIPTTLAQLEFGYFTTPPL